MNLFPLAALALLAPTGLAAAPLDLRHGVGVHDWLNWAPIEADGSYSWPPYRSETDWLAGARPLSDWPAGDQFERMKVMGFDFVRLTADPGPLVASEGKRRQEALDVVEAVVRRIADTGLKVVFDLHGVSQVPEYSMEMIYGGADSEGVKRYRAMVADVAGMLVEVGVERVAVEPYNEPAYYPCDASGTDDWQRIMADTVADIRAVSADLPIVATGACGGSISGLTNLDPSFDDPNIYYSLHMYEPHSFTHQRAENPDDFASGLPWPAAMGTAEIAIETLKARMDAAGLSKPAQARNLLNVQAAVAAYFAEDWGQSQLEARMGEAVTWAKLHGIETQRLFVGEFGAILITPDGRMGAYDADRLRYLAAVRQEVEKFDMPWSIWEYSNPFGMSVILPEGPAIPDGPMLEALGLNAKAQ